MRWARLAVLFAVACAESEDGALTARFTERPAVLLIHPDIERCTAELTQAALWWRERGATFVVEHGEGFEAAFHGKPQTGVIAVMPLTDARMHDGFTEIGRTNPAWTLTGDIFAAELLLGNCSGMMIRHEMGHVLGLVHVDIHGNVMYRNARHAGEELTEEQAAWVLD